MKSKPIIQKQSNDAIRCIAAVFLGAVISCIVAVSVHLLLAGIAGSLALFLYLRGSYKGLSAKGTPLWSGVSGRKPTAVAFIMVVPYTLMPLVFVPVMQHTLLYLLPT